MNNLQRTLFLLRCLQGRDLPGALRVMRRIAVAGIVLGTATLIVALAALTGFERVYTQAILSFNAHVVLLRGQMEPVEDEPEFLETLRASPEIVALTPFLYREGLMLAGNTIKGVMFKGINILAEQNAARMHFTDFHTTDRGVWLGEVLWQQLFAQETSIDEVNVMLPNVDAQNLRPARFERMPLRGTFSSGMYDFDAHFAMIDLDELRSLFRLSPSTLTGFELWLDEPLQAEAVIERLTPELPPGYQFISWRQLNQELFSAIALERLVFSVIMGLLTVVASLNIIVVLVLFAMYRSHALALLRTMGLRQCFSRKLLMWVGIRLGGQGAMFGVGLGVFLCWLLRDVFPFPLDAQVYFVSRLPLDISPAVCGTVAAFCLSLCTLVAWSASRFLVKGPIAEDLQKVYG